jgi:hypothetical protein
MIVDPPVPVGGPTLGGAPTLGLGDDGGGALTGRPAGDGVTGNDDGVAGKVDGFDAGNGDAAGDDGRDDDGIDDDGTAAGDDEGSVAGVETGNDVAP